ncbi:amidoligase family protein [Polymorphum gilvum]|nr:amidoligase family protein [Polymorphum gilvum]
MSLSTTMLKPPRTAGPDGKPRRIGVELEFAAISARDGARLVQALYGGSIAEEDPHRFFVRDTALGAFVCELDSQYVHAAPGENDATAAAGDPAKEFLFRFRAGFRKVLGDLSAYLVPCEIVCPPVSLDRLPEIETLVAALRDAGAESTRSSPLYAFAAQLNPEIASADADYLTAMLKAYLLLSDWLRAAIDLHATRRIAPFADPFPRAYAMKVVAPDYKPDLGTLMDDYLAANPTRNRELDLMPLFAWLDAERVQRAVHDPLIKARPTFHYRLPDSRLGEPDWGILLEWNRWCLVERLAENGALLAAMGEAYRRHHAAGTDGRWAIKASEWLLLS